MATIRDVAKIAGVSVATVSHVVNKTRYVSPELVKKVEDAINSLEYPPNFVVKKTWKNKETDTEFVLLLATDIQNPFQRAYIQLCENMFSTTDYLLIVADYHDNFKKLELYNSVLINNSYCRGLIVMPGLKQFDDFLLKHLNRNSIPVVFVGKAIEGLEGDVISSDNRGGAYKAANHLIKSGHERIALICGNRHTESNLERIAGFEKAIQDNGIEVVNDFILTDLLTEEALFEALKRILSIKNPPTAIFAANYLTIISLIKYINTNNIQCPQELSIVGFNDFDWAPFHNPPITTISQDIENLSRISFDCIIRRINERVSGQKSPLENHVVSTELNVRNSTQGIGRGPFGEKASSPIELMLSDSEKRIVQAGNFSAAIAFHYTGKSFMHLHEQGIREVFNALNISILAVTDAHFDSQMQSRQLESLLTLEPDILITFPTDNVKTAPIFKRIANSKTKLVLITNVPSGLTTDDYVTCVSVNERSYGRNVGMGLGNYMRKHNKRNIGFITYNANFYATNQRDQAAEQIISEEFTDLIIAGSISFSHEDEAYDAALDLLNRNPQIEGIYVSWEGPTMHVMRALSDINRTDIAIATADLEYPLAYNMAKGGMIKALSAQTPYEQGQAMALAAANALINKKVSSFIGVEPIIVTPDNLLKSWQKVFHERPPVKITEELNIHIDPDNMVI
jgi:ribose transport system substrate-binding protein